MSLPTDYWKNPQMHNVFRTKPCQRLAAGGSCSWGSQCQFSHSVHWPRRPHRSIMYSPELCPKVHITSGPNPGEVRIINSCTLGGKCALAHSKEEVLYHPWLFKTCLCEEHASNKNQPTARGRRKKHCHRHYCPFAHGTKELRTSPLSPEKRKEYLLAALAKFPHNWCCKVCEPQRARVQWHTQIAGGALETFFVVANAPEPEDLAAEAASKSSVDRMPPPPAPFGSKGGYPPAAYSAGTAGQQAQAAYYAAIAHQAAARAAAVHAAQAMAAQASGLHGLGTAPPRGPLTLPPPSAGLHGGLPSLPADVDAQRVHEVYAAALAAATAAAQAPWPSAPRPAVSAQTGGGLTAEQRLAAAGISLPPGLQGDALPPAEELEAEESEDDLGSILCPPSGDDSLLYLKGNPFGREPPLSELPHEFPGLLDFQKEATFQHLLSVFSDAPSRRPGDGIAQLAAMNALAAKPAVGRGTVPSGDWSCASTCSLPPPRRPIASSGDGSSSSSTACLTYQDDEEHGLADFLGVA
eukprot:TRINITY_DN14904_c0_g1_i1.p1 TRINITY_DN14904_c0_g1~~TRINITY_DN14904_c0_g1_i1.p1  ORF type:complete len:523 (-),score=99.17 TRINITY_DN14904_c0_g1_i1:60-1628(-)